MIELQWKILKLIASEYIRGKKKKKRNNTKQTKPPSFI